MNFNNPIYEIKDSQGETVMVSQVSDIHHGVKCNWQVGIFQNRQAAEKWVADPVRTRTYERDQATDQLNHNQLGAACKAAGVGVPRSRAGRLDKLKSLPLKA